MGNPLLRQAAIIDRAVKIDDGGDLGIGRLMSADVVHQKSAGGFADQGNSVDVDVVLGGVSFDPLNGTDHVFIGLFVMNRGREAIIHTEPGKAGIRQWLEQRADVGAFAAFVEAAAVYEDGGGKRAGAIGYMKVQQDGRATGFCVLDVFKIDSIKSCGEHNQREGAHWWNCTLICDKLNILNARWNPILSPSHRAIPGLRERWSKMTT